MLHYVLDRTMCSIELMKKANITLSDTLKARSKLHNNACCTSYTYNTSVTHSVYLAIFDGLKTSFLDVASNCVKLHISEHHNSTQQQCSWVGFILTCNVWCSTMNLHMSITRSVSIKLPHSTFQLLAKTDFIHYRVHSSVDHTQLTTEDSLAGMLGLDDCI